MQVDTAALQSERSQSVDLEMTVEMADIDPVYFEKTYYVSPRDGGQASIKSARPTHADNGKPPVSALPRQIKSGTTPKCSQANHFPVRPKPV